jgi:hypothetical protein
MEFDPRTDRLPFNEPDEAEPARAGATESCSDARIRHLQRVPLFSGFNEDELRRIAELARIVDVPAGSAVTEIESPPSHSLSSSTARWRCERPLALAPSYTRVSFLAR